MSEPPENPPPENPPPTIPPPANPPPANPPNDPDWKAPFEALTATVQTIAEAVSKLAPGDETPVKRPWTHIGSRPRNER